MKTPNDDSSLIDALGGTGRVAALCGLTAGAVSQWRGNGMPKAWREFLRLARPAVFDAWDARRRSVSEASPPQDTRPGP